MSRYSLLGALGVALILICACSGGASAAELCKSGALDPCAVANVYPAGRMGVFDASVNRAGVTFTTANGLINPTITCRTSDVTVQKTAAGGVLVDVGIALTNLTFAACASGGPAGCAATAGVGGLPATGTVAFTAMFNGKMDWNPPPTITFTCPSGGANIACSFGGGRRAVTGVVTGGIPATFTYDRVVVAAAAGNPAGCPTQAIFTATYTLSAVNRNPTTLWVTSS